jgi:hypothetical protein
MERLQLVTHLHNRNKCFIFQEGNHSVNIVTDQLLPAYKLIHQFKLFLHKTVSYHEKKLSLQMFELSYSGIIYKICIIATCFAFASHKL